MKGQTKRRRNTISSKPLGLFLNALQGEPKGWTKKLIRAQAHTERANKPSGRISYFRLTPLITKIESVHYYCFNPKEFRNALKESEQMNFDEGYGKGIFLYAQIALKEMQELQRKGVINQQSAIDFAKKLLGVRDKEELRETLKKLGFKWQDIRKNLNPSKRRLGSYVEPLYSVNGEIKMR